MRFLQSIALPIRAVFKPRGFSGDGEALERLKGWGLPLMALRWLAYVAIFLLRDYETLQPPCVEPPFGLDLGGYRLLEIYTAPVFGALLIGALVLTVWGYLRLRGQSAPVGRILDAIGVAFFVPWLAVSVGDLALIHVGMWRLAVVAPIHTVVLGWEAWGAVALGGGRVTV